MPYNVSWQVCMSWAINKKEPCYDNVFELINLSIVGDLNIRLDILIKQINCPVYCLNTNKIEKIIHLVLLKFSSLCQ